MINVNDYPLLIVPKQLQIHALQSVYVDGISIVDVDPPTYTYQVTLRTDESGALTLTDSIGAVNHGIQFTQGDGQEDSIMQFSGLLHHINRQLRRLSYRITNINIRSNHDRYFLFHISHNIHLSFVI